jgi:uncharacterized SAM-binding protein YcdF (DUF218 family)
LRWSRRDHCKQSMRDIRTWKAALRWLGIAASAALAITLFTPFWNSAGERLAVKPAVRPGDAIVVLGAGVKGGALVDESLRRTLYGMELFKRGMAPIIVFSGPAEQEEPSLSEAEVRQNLAEEMGIPHDRIITVSKVLTTREESQQVAAELEKLHATSVLLVTEALHMRRAMAVFEKAGLKTIPAPSDDLPRIAVSPSGRLKLMWRVLLQAGGLVYYRVAGYV